MFFKKYEIVVLLQILLKKKLFCFLITLLYIKVTVTESLHLPRISQSIRKGLFTRWCGARLDSRDPCKFNGKAVSSIKQCVRNAAAARFSPVCLLMCLCCVSCVLYTYLHVSKMKLYVTAFRLNSQCCVQTLATRGTSTRTRGWFFRTRSS